MTPIEQARVQKLKDRIVTLKEQLRTARAKGKGGISARGRGGAARPVASKGRTRARTRSARSGAAEASA